MEYADKSRLKLARLMFRSGRTAAAIAEMMDERQSKNEKSPQRFRLLREIYQKFAPITQESIGAEPWQPEFLSILYGLWPKTHLEDAVLKHDFPEPQTGEYVVSGAESIQLATFEMAEKPVALSRGRQWLKLWELETGKVIRAEEIGLEIIASAIGRDSSHVLTASPWSDSTGELRWSPAFRETLRRVSCPRGGTYEKSHYANVINYPVRGEIIQMTRVGGYGDYAHEVTLKHEEIEGYLPAGTTAFLARSNEHYGLKVDDLSYGRVTAKLAVEDGECWLEQIIGKGHGLKGMYSTFTTPITELCISADGALGLANGDGANFGLWNLWTGDRLRQFSGHTGRVTCICPSVDVSVVVSGSEDKTLRSWDPRTAECVRVFEGHENVISKVRVSLDATKILSGDHDGVIKLWDSATGECLRTIQAHSNNVSGLYLTLDGRFAVSGSWDTTVKLWNLTDGSCMKTLAHGDWITSVDMTPDGRYLASSSYEGTKVWELLWGLEPREFADWDEAAGRSLQVLLNANAAWEGKLSTPVDMTEEEIRNTLRREGPSWIAWHAPSKKNDWHRVWHLGWDVEKTLGHAGYGWLTGAGREAGKISDAWQKSRES